jgi:hypothetical protein
MANRNNNIKQTKFCKFCKDSGKNESIYTSHNVKDKNGNTCCPILMTTLCNNCRVFGHTVKFCKAITPINKNNKNTLQKTTQINIEIKKKNENMNRYSVFDEDDEDVEPVKCEPEKIVKKAESIFVKYKRRVEDWADECSDTDDD